MNQFEQDRLRYRQSWLRLQDLLGARSLPGAQCSYCDGVLQMHPYAIARCPKCYDLVPQGSKAAAENWIDSLLTFQLLGTRPEAFALLQWEEWDDGLNEDLNARYLARVQAIDGLLKEFEEAYATRDLTVTRARRVLCGAAMAARVGKLYSGDLIRTVTLTVRAHPETEAMLAPARKWAQGATRDDNILRTADMYRPGVGNYYELRGVVVRDHIARSKWWPTGNASDPTT